MKSQSTHFPITAAIHRKSHKMKLRIPYFGLLAAFRVEGFRIVVSSSRVIRYCFRADVIFAFESNYWKN
ncbi:hypothetical protein ACH3XW_17495 [Acanthocheilonema viteae]